MAATTRVSSSPPANTPQITVTENGSCIPRIAKIAVPILAALASFVFLPFLAAAALTIGTTAMVFTYLGAGTTNSATHPTKTGKPEIEYNDHFITLTFKTHEEKQQFGTQYKSRFPAFAEFIVFRKVPKPIITISLPNQNSPQNREQIRTILNQIMAE